MIGVRIPPLDRTGSPNLLMLDVEPGTGRILLDLYVDRIRVATTTLELPTPALRGTHVELELVGLFTMAGLDAVRREAAGA